MCRSVRSSAAVLLEVEDPPRLDDVVDLLLPVGGPLVDLAEGATATLGHPGRHEHDGRLPGVELGPGAGLLHDGAGKVEQRGEDHRVAHLRRQPPEQPAEHRGRRVGGRHVEDRSGVPLREVGRPVQADHRLPAAGGTLDQPRPLPAGAHQRDLLGGQEGHPAAQGGCDGRPVQRGGQRRAVAAAARHRQHAGPRDRRHRRSHPARQRVRRVVRREVAREHVRDRVDLRLLQARAERADPDGEVVLTDHVDVVGVQVESTTGHHEDRPQRLAGDAEAGERVLHVVREAAHRRRLGVAALLAAEQAAAADGDVLPVLDVEDHDPARSDEDRVDGRPARPAPSAVGQHPPAEELEPVDPVRGRGVHPDREAVPGGQLAGPLRLVGVARSRSRDVDVVPHQRVDCHAAHPPWCCLTLRR